jgi:tetratricopeptide (TPR) repeat protein
VIEALRDLLPIDSQDVVVDVLVVPRQLGEPLTGDLGANIEMQRSLGRRWLSESVGDMLVYGTVVRPDKTFELQFLWKSYSWRFVYTLNPDTASLPREFYFDAVAAVASAAADRIDRSYGERTTTASSALKPIVAWLSQIAHNPQPKDMAIEEYKALLFGYATAVGGIGAQLKDRNDINESINAFRSLLRLTSPVTPSDWAIAQYRLGNAIGNLGLITNSSKLIEQAISCYAKALGVYAKSDDKWDWALVQSALGYALEVLAERKNDTKSLERAIAADRESLKVYTQSNDSLDWAFAQSNLGYALADLADRRNDGGLLEDAIAADHEALKAYTRNGDPDNWALVQRNLGYALAELADHRNDGGLLEEAITADHEALKANTRNKDPADWALVQRNLGYALSDLAYRKHDPRLLEEAIAADREALKLFTRSEDRDNWALVQTNLGNALAELGNWKKDIRSLKDAAAVDREILDVYTQNNDLSNWALVQSNLGDALADLADDSGDMRLFEGAVAADNSALRVYTPKSAPSDWARVQNNLAYALANLGIHRRDTLLLRQALIGVRSALSIYSQDKYPNQWAWAHGIRGFILYGLADIDNANDRELLDEAIAADRLALTILEPAKDSDIGWVRSNLGAALARLGAVNRNSSMQGEGIRLLQQALEAYARQNNASDLARTKALLQHARQLNSP